MKFLQELLDFARKDPGSCKAIMKWVVLGIALLTIIKALDVAPAILAAL